MMNTLLNIIVFLVFLSLGITIAGKVLKLLFILIAICAVVNLLSGGGIL